MKKRSNSSNTVEDALVDLYLSIKIRKQYEIDNIDSNAINEERENLRKTNPLTIMEYIRNSIDILTDLKVEERLESHKKKNDESEEEKVNEYESLLRKLEADIRQHIRMEHQLKLHSESLQSRIDELEKENAESGKNKPTSEKTSNAKKIESKDKRESEINNLKTEIQNLKQILKSYEDQAIKLSDLEKKLRNQNIKHEKEMKSLEDKYKSKIKTFSKKISGYEEMLKVNTSFKTLRRENEDDLDRVNYDDVSQNDINKSHLTSRKSPIPSTDRKKDSDGVKEKIDHYRKLIDKKINEISHSNVNKTLNKSNMAEITNDRSSSNHSFLTKDKTLDNNSSKSYRKNDSLIKNLEHATKKILAKDNYKTHYRHSSMEVKYDTKAHDKSPNGLTKNIHAMKEMLFNNNNNSSTSKIKTLNKSSNKNTQKPTKSNQSSNIILNQGGNPCFNQITIYTTNNNSNIKPNEINLRNYIFNKVNKPKSSAKVGSHTRSASNNINH